MPNWEKTMKNSILAVAAAMSVALATGASFGADAAAGEAEFKKCAACHMVGENAKSRVGPILNDVFGRTAGTLEGYKYSQAMIDAGAAGLVWTEETVDQFIHKPKEVVPGTKMSFAGIQDETARQNLIAYLLTFSPNYVPGAADGASSEAAGDVSSEASSAAAN